MLVGTDSAFGFDPRVAVEHVRDSDAARARAIDAVGAFDLPLTTVPTVVRQEVSSGSGAGWEKKA